MIGSDYVLEALNIYHTTDVSFQFKIKFCEVSDEPSFLSYKM